MQEGQSITRARLDTFHHGTVEVTAVSSPIQENGTEHMRCDSHVDMSNLRLDTCKDNHTL